ncbi:DSD1 family PLP-dependent enzyme [soil metagenome]
MKFPGVKFGDSARLIDTPALVLDLDVFERNLVVMASWAAERHVRLRPHAKAHRCAAISAMQIAAGAAGVCVQTLGEAEALVDAGALAGLPLDDIHLSNEIVDPRKLDRLVALLLRAPALTFSLVVDSALGIDRLAAALRASDCLDRIAVVVEVDVGQGRCGVQPTQAGRLARQVVSHGLRFAGLQAYQGKAQHLRSAAEREAATLHAAQLARAAQASVTAVGVACPLVTGSGTGTFNFDAASGVYNELQPGSYLFMDADYERNEPAAGAPRFEQSLFVRSQVISRGVSHAVIDAGQKSHSIDSGMPRVHGVDLEFRSSGDEHGTLHPKAWSGVAATARLASPGTAPPAPGTPRAGDLLPQIGDIVWLVPGHCDPTVNLHDFYVGVRGGLVEGVVERFFAIDARGCST